MSGIERAKIIARGAVQGVGFRPFVHRLAVQLDLRGFVLNSNAGVVIEIEGQGERVRRFIARVEREKPPLAILQSIESSFLDPVGYQDFEIRESDERGAKTALILPDISTCADCLREIFDPGDRRFRYPFTNCTNCGPRFSIIEALPYDRANTSMKKFTMCADCELEYHDPRDRRFHAQPNACPRCGPQLKLWNSSVETLAENEDALRKAADAVRAGTILALKGLGGFQLIVDARNDAAVVRLRERKHREEKPFAVMFPSLESVRACCAISELEERLLLSPESPIVLLTKKLEIGNWKLAMSIAPGNPNLGATLPYTPLHHLLLRELDFPIVATSGNISDEPICIDETEALRRLAGIADVFLVHHRPIVRPIDDSVTRIICNRELILRRARGYAPLPVVLSSRSGNEGPRTVLAVGAHLKNSIALKAGENVFVSQHIGDLATSEAYESFLRTVKDLPRLYSAEPELLVCDLHPDYLSTKYAHDLAASPKKHGSQVVLLCVQHHYAHVLSCMAENEIAPPVLGVAWDGTGLGADETIWGGEFLRVTEGGYERIAHFRTFALPGGEAAVKEPPRTLVGILHEIFGEEVWQNPIVTGTFPAAKLAPMRTMLEKEINCPRTSSAGRLFDAVAALLRVNQRSSFEGQAAMELEFATQADVGEAYSFKLDGRSPIIVDWEPVILAIIDDMACETSVGVMSAKFHNALAETIIALARRAGEEKVVLSGGCFQNRYLTERAVAGLRGAKFRPYWHQRVPPNDGGIALGQIAAAAWQGN